MARLIKILFIAVSIVIAIPIFDTLYSFFSRNTRSYATSVTFPDDED